MLHEAHSPRVQTPPCSVVPPGEGAVRRPGQPLLDRDHHDRTANLRRGGRHVLAGQAVGPATKPAPSLARVTDQDALAGVAHGSRGDRQRRRRHGEVTLAVWMRDQQPTPALLTGSRVALLARCCHADLSRASPR